MIFRNSFPPPDSIDPREAERQRSAATARELGVTAINVRGGMAAWKRATLPTASG